MEPRPLPSAGAPLKFSNPDIDLRARQAAKATHEGCEENAYSPGRLLWVS